MRGPVELLKGAWGIFMQNPRLFIGIYLVPAIITFIYTLYIGTTAGNHTVPSSVNPIAIAILVIALMVANIMMGIAMMKAVSQPMGMTVGGAYRYAKEHFWPYLLIALFVGAATIAGFILFIIPGIIFAIWFTFSYYVYLFEGKRGTEALKASKAYVKGHWWAVFGRYAFLIIIGIAFSIVMGIVATILQSGLESIGAAISTFVFDAILIPVVIGYTYLMYKDISRMGPAPAEVSSDEEKTDETDDMSDSLMDRS